MIVVLGGGVGAARFLRGVVRVVPPGTVTAIVNVGDDITLHGLRICPDLDSVTYTLAGLVHPEQQWGRADERFTVRDELRRLGGTTWFTLGDRDLALHLHRTESLAGGRTLSEVTAEVARALGVGIRLLPVTDEPLTTRIGTTDGRDLHFQEWWVGERGLPDVATVSYAGSEAARAAPGVVEAITGADAILLAPSNPVVSIRPLLAVTDVAAALAAAPAPTVGVSPLIGGRVVRGMADRLLPAVGVGTTAAAVARWYGARGDGGLLDGWVVDDIDAGAVGELSDLPIRTVATETLMDDPDVAAGLARTCLDLAGVTS